MCAKNASVDEMNQTNCDGVYAVKHTKPDVNNHRYYLKKNYVVFYYCAFCLFCALDRFVQQVENASLIESQQKLWLTNLENKLLRLMETSRITHSPNAFCLFVCFFRRQLNAIRTYNSLSIRL